MHSNYGTASLRVMITCVVLAGVTLLSLALASGVESKKSLQQTIGTFQQTEYRYVLTVCPVGPPTCQYKKIQDAIDAAPEDLSSPRPKPPITKIQVGPGIYEENLVIRKSVVLEGAGRDKVLLRPSSAQTGQEAWVGILVVGNIGGVTVEISGFHIQATDKGNSVGVMAVGLLTGAKLYQNRFQNPFIGIYVDEAQVSIEENDFVSSKVGSFSSRLSIAAEQIARIQIRRNTLEDESSISIQGARRALYPNAPEPNVPGERVLIEGNQGAQISVLDGAAIAIRKNTTRRIKLDRSDLAVIEENVVRKADFSFNGIEVVASNQVLIQKNVVEENSGNGIFISGLDFSQKRALINIVDNHVLRNGKFGIATEIIDYIAVCKNNEVKDNKMGDYGMGRFPQASQELKLKCEGN